MNTEQTMNLRGYIQKILARAEKKLPAHYWQAKALETAEKLKDLKSKGIYMKIYKLNRNRIGELDEYRDWCLKNLPRAPGEAFVKKWLTRIPKT